MAEYLSVEEARHRPGLRLVLTRGVPGPWGEAAKGLFHVKGIPFARVSQEAGGANEALRAWTGQASAPVAVLDDEPPCTTRFAILHLAERLEPWPRLLPEEPEARADVLGWMELIAGEMGFGWCRRLMMIDALERAAELPAPVRAIASRLASRYGYLPAEAAAAPERAAAILAGVGRRLRSQAARGSRHLVGDALSAADITWAAFAALVQPLPEAQCPMSGPMRASYESRHPALREALDPIVLEHRNFVYEGWLELPVDL